jgi:hypothetical protein
MKEALPWLVSYYFVGGEEFLRIYKVYELWELETETTYIGRLLTNLP